MGKRPKKGFNAPFSQLAELAKAKAAADERAAAKAAPPAKPALAERMAPVSDADLFAQAMRGTARLDSKRGVRLPAPVPEARPMSDDEQLALAELENLVKGRGEFRVHESEEMHTGLAPGVSFQLLERLQKGHFAYHRHLDLHGHVRDSAHQELGRFIAAARRDGERCVLVVTGRGKSSPNGVSVIRDALPRWLSRAPLRPHVLAFCTARAVDGGPGAFYVLLRRAGVKPFGTPL